MNKTRWMMLIAFLLSFAAGAVFGALFHRAHSSETSPMGLARSLNLKPEQETKLQQIWSDLIHKPSAYPDEERLRLARERDAEIRKLLTPEQLSQFEKISENFTQQLREQALRRKARIEEAVKNTKEILTEEQRKKYEILLQKKTNSSHNIGSNL